MSIEDILESWCIFTFCPRTGPRRGESNFFICDHHWNLITKELKAKAEKWDEEQLLTSREEYEKVMTQQTNLINKHYNLRLEAERKLEAVKKVLHDEATWFSENKMKRDWLEEIKGILEG